MPAHPPLSTLANATVASSGTCHCYPEWHNFPVKLTNLVKSQAYQNWENRNQTIELVIFLGGSFVVLILVEKV